MQSGWTLIPIGPGVPQALLLALGLFLLVVAARKIAGRPGPDQQPETPKWMRGISEFGSGKSFLVGVSVGALNPKNVAVAVASSVVIATAELPAVSRSG